MGAKLPAFDRPMLMALIAGLAILAAACSSGSPASPTASASSAPDLSAGPPTWPQVYSGGATAAGRPVPAGFTVVGRVDDYESQPVTTLEGRYLALTIAPLEPQWWSKTITFHMVGPGGAEVEAEQTAFFERRDKPSVDNQFSLKFPRLP